MKLKQLLEGYAWERKPGQSLPTLKDVRKIHEQSEPNISPRDWEVVDNDGGIQIVVASVNGKYYRAEAQRQRGEVSISADTEIFNIEEIDKREYNKMGGDDEFTKMDANPTGEQLAEDIYDAINNINDSMSYKDLAFAVARVLEDSYGTHNYDRFISELKSNLDKMRD